MASIEYYWTKTEDPIRISEYATNIGFNLRSLDYENIPDDKREWINKKIRYDILAEISDCWEDEDQERNGKLSSVKQGIYVISLADNMSIDYNGNPSKVIYIGRGCIRSRLATHFKYWIKTFNDSLQDISFDIWMTEIRHPGSKNAFKEVEADLLDYFCNKYDCYPIQNSISGDIHNKNHDYDNDWNRPLRNPPDINNGWAIRPLKNNDWAIEFEE